MALSVFLIATLFVPITADALEIREAKKEDYYSERDEDGELHFYHKVWEYEDLKQDLIPSGAVALNEEIKPIQNQLRCIYNSYEDIVNDTPTYSPEVETVRKQMKSKLSARQICSLVVAIPNHYSNTYVGEFYKPNDVSKAAVIGLVGVTAHGSVYVNVKPRFADVKLEQNYWDEIEYLANRGIVNGTSKTQFSPNAHLTKIHVASMLSRALKLEQRYPENYAFSHAFSDVGKDHYAYLDIMRATEAGIFDKTETFNGSNKFTRGEMAVALTRGFDIKGTTVKPKSFSDVTVAKVGQEMYDAVQKLSMYSIAQGQNGEFKPNEPLSRQHFAVFLTRTMVDGAGFRYIYLIR